MKRVFLSWRQALSLLEPPQLRNFFFIARKASGRLYKLIIAYGWPPIALWFVVWFITWALVFPHIYAFLAYRVFSALMRGTLLFLLIALARSSVDRKGYGYLREKIRWAAYLIPFFAIVPLLLLPGALVFGLFLFDSHGFLGDIGRAVINTLKMGLYNAPLGGMVWLIYGVGYQVATTNMMTWAAGFMVFPVFVVLLVSLYQKRLYDDSGLYQVK